jgi:hypothetical protein
VLRCIPLRQQQEYLPFNITSGNAPRFAVSLRPIARCLTSRTLRPRMKGRNKDLRSGEFSDAGPVRGYTYAVQKCFTQFNVHCSSPIIPQPRKPNHTIITDKINAPSKQIATLLQVWADRNPSLSNGFGSFADRWRSFIRLPLFYKRRVTASCRMINLNDKLT